MSSLLTFLNITNDATYRAWCLKNHPDKRPDADAVRQFQEVSGDYNKYIRGKTTPAGKTPPPTSKATTAPAGKTPPPRSGHVFYSRVPYQCGAHVPGLGSCRLRTLRAGRCFYHEKPENLRFVEGDHVRFFMMNPIDQVLYGGMRNRDMCTARNKTGKFCRKKKKQGLEVCCRHHTQ
jgi:hypothetical protein